VGSLINENNVLFAFLVFADWEISVGKLNTTADTGKESVDKKEKVGILLTIREKTMGDIFFAKFLFLWKWSTTKNVQSDSQLVIRKIKYLFVFFENYFYWLYICF
jgi:hypothetical protein